MKKENMMIVLNSIVTLILYFGWIILTQLIFSSGITSTNFIISFFVSILFLILFVFQYRIKLKNDYQTFLKNKYYTKIFISYITIIAIFLVVIGIMKIYDFDYTNNILDEINLMPFAGLFKVLIFAPIVEEIVFRASFKNAIKQKSLFILVSSLIYGFLHIAFIGITTTTLIGALPFALCGLILSYIYLKYDNLVLNILVSFLCNISFLLVLLI